MISLKIIIIGLFGLYLLILGVTFVSFSNSQERELTRTIFSEEKVEFLIDRFKETRDQSKIIAYKFINPALAFKALNMLDVFSQVNERILREKCHVKNRYTVPFLNLKNDDDYCKNHRQYIVEHPESIFENINTIFDYIPRSILRTKVIPSIGVDLRPEISLLLPKSQRNQFVFDVPPDANSFFTKATLFKHKAVGIHFSCLSQMSNHIPGSSSLSTKDNVARAANSYIKQFKNRSECLSHDKIFPKTWILSSKKGCQAFFEAINSVEYQRLKQERGIVYIRKIAINAHSGEGVQPVNEKEELALKATYENGKLCGQVTLNNIIQHYVHNPLLINGRKFDFRMFMLIASTNPLIAFYHDGVLRVSLFPYDANSDDKKVLLTNIALNSQIYEDANAGKLFQGMDQEQLMVAQQWSFDRLQTYLLEAGVINDPNWLDNYLRPEFKKAMIYLLRVGADSFYEQSSLYELFGVDFMLDADLNLWFIEANAQPAFKKYSQETENFIVKMLQDHFRVVSSLMRSRMKRIINFVNRVIEDGMIEEGENGEVSIRDLEQQRIVFKEISKNYFEKEFELDPDNGFSKIIDANYQGVEIYQGLIEEKCL